MRKSVLSRSLIAIASLAVASATLAAVPATAATASGITRDQVLAATAAARVDNPAIDPGEFAPIGSRAIRVLANRACAVDPDSELVYFGSTMPTQAGDDADGLLVSAVIMDLSDLMGGGPSGPEGRLCTFGALATADPSFSLSGTATLNYQTTSTHSLSGDAYVTPARSFKIADLEGIEEGTLGLPSFSASGNATKTTPVKVSTPKTTKQRQAAKKAYSKALKLAKKSYIKANKKAEDSKKKKAAAKKAYSKKKATAKAKYKKATATFKIVNSIDSRPFAISAVAPELS